MNLKIKSALKIMLFNLLIPLAAASAPPMTWVKSFINVAYALGWLMMVLMGLKWIIAESANERAEAKKGMIYIVVGLLIVASARSLLQLYCNTVGDSGIAIDCDLDKYFS
jgi:hypothetical protein